MISDDDVKKRRYKLINKIIIYDYFLPQTIVNKIMTNVCDKEKICFRSGERIS